MSYEVYFDTSGNELPGSRKDWGLLEDGRKGTAYYAVRDKSQPMSIGIHPFQTPNNWKLIYFDPTGAFDAPTEKEALRQAQLAAEGNPIWNDRTALTSDERNNTVGTIGKKKAKVLSSSSGSTSLSQSRFAATTSVAKSLVTSPTGGGPAKPVDDGSDVLTIDSNPSDVDDERNPALTDVWRAVTVEVVIRGAKQVVFDATRTWAWLGPWYASTTKLMYPTGHIIRVVEGDLT